MRGPVDVLAVAWMTPEAIAHLAKQNGPAKVDAWNCASGGARVPVYAQPMQQGGGEVMALRAEQAAAVMPLIGPLLDAWERTHPDDSVHDSGIARYIEPINRAMEDGIAPSAPYSIDADADGIRARVADAITGALAFGAQGTHKPPAGHWLEPFWDMARAEAQAHGAPVGPHTYASTQATKCAGCGEHKHTPLRIDAMGGYVCLTCIDQKLGSLLGEFGYAPSAPVGVEAIRQARAIIDHVIHGEPGYELSAAHGLLTAAIARVQGGAP